MAILEDYRSLIINYTYEHTSILLINPFNGITVETHYRYQYQEMHSIKSFVDYFECEKLINRHKYLNQIIKNATIIDLKLLDEKDNLDLNDLWLTIKPRIKKADNNIKLTDDIDIECMKMFLYKYGDVLLKLY